MRKKLFQKGNSMDIEKEKIRRKIKSIKSLPTLPAVALKVGKMIENKLHTAY
jgi:hypothetical protein